MAISICSNLAILVFFKYLGTFIEDWAWIEARTSVMSPDTGNILLPLGLSFYTLQSMGYTIDVFRGKVTAERHFGYFALYVSFFPQLVAGPIERPGRLLPQLRAPKPVSWADIESGGFLILLGLVKKVVVTDRLFVLLRAGMDAPGDLSGWQALVFGSLVLVAVYLDFSAYTDIARGSARLFGIELMRNFKRPLAARSQGEFFQRWHISLSSWLMDYLFVPLARRARARWQRNAALLATFAIMGLWHGPTLPFLLFGLISGLAVTVERVAARAGWRWPQTPGFDALRRLRVHLILNISGVMFLAPGLSEAGAILRRVADGDFWGIGVLSSLPAPGYFLLVLLSGLALLSWMGAISDIDAAVARLSQRPAWQRVLAAFGLLFMAVAFAERLIHDFIYFDF